MKSDDFEQTNEVFISLASCPLAADTFSLLRAAGNELHTRRHTNQGTAQVCSFELPDRGANDEWSDDPWVLAGPAKR